MDTVQQNRLSATSIFDRGFVCGKALYLYCFGTIPSAHFMNLIDGEKAFAMLQEQFKELIVSEHSYRWYDSQAKSYTFDETFVVLNNRCIVEFDTEYCEIYHDGTQQAFIEAFSKNMRQFKQRQRRKPLEINLVTAGRNGLQLTALEIKRTKLDLNLYYEDDFAAVDKVITQRLSRPKDKGVVLLHGLPGTGKTTYLRHLIGRIKKRVLFLSPGVAQDIMSPQFMELLVQNPNSVLVIEDAENIIMDRRYTSQSPVSGLLNIADGLMADFLSIQVICTFNSSLTSVDSALLRQGRLISRYEFNKLSVAKAQRLSAHLGFKTSITEPMTLAAIAAQDEAKYELPKPVEVQGFRRTEPVLN